MSIEELTGLVEERYQTNSLQENNSTAEGEEK
jgi:hypothetical protein